MPRGWMVVDGHHLYRKWTFPDFKEALDFVNKIGVLAEAANHHPNITFTWGCVELSLWSHDVDEITDRDHALAAEINAMLSS